WIMRQGAYAVVVHVDGPAGSGDATVPYTATAQGVLTMNVSMAVVLAAAGVFLVAGMLTIISAAAGEAMLAPGAEPGAGVPHRARRVRWIAAGIIAAILVGGRIWWMAEDRAYAAMVFRPTAARATVREVPAPTDGRPVKRGHEVPPTRMLRF